jgi:hypothetical protein
VWPARSTKEENTGSKKKHRGWSSERRRQGGDNIVLKCNKIVGRGLGVKGTEEDYLQVGRVFFLLHFPFDILRFQGSLNGGNRWGEILGNGMTRNVSWVGSGW